MNTETQITPPKTTTAARTPRRRMRRSTHSSHVPHPSHSSHKPSPNRKLARRRSSPFQTLPEFASLTRDQLEYIHEIIRNKTLADAQQEIWSELHFRLHQSTLHRYKHKLLFAQSLDLVDDATAAVDQLHDLLAARETSISAAGQLIVQKRALAIASYPETSPSLLPNLHRIFTYEDRKEEKRLTEERRHAQRLELAQLRENTRLQVHEERKTMNAHKRDLDLEKLKLARQRLALDREKQNQNNNTCTDEQQRQMSEKIQSIMAYGRAYLAQEREKERVKAQASANSSTSVEVDVTRPFRPSIPNAHSSHATPSATAPCGADNLSAHLNNQNHPHQTRTQQTINHTNQ